MARRIICSEFSPSAMRMARPILMKQGFKPLKVEDSPAGNWSWPKPHKSILDLKPLLLTENTEPVSLATLEPRPRMYVPPKEERSAAKIKSVGVGEATKTVKTHSYKTALQKLNNKKWHKVRRAARIVTNEDKLWRNRERVGIEMLVLVSMELPPAPEPNSFWDF